MESLLIWFLALLSARTVIPAPQVAPPPVRVVTMGVELPSGSKATLSVRSGDRATARPANGPKFGLTPTLFDDDRIELVIVEISVDPVSGVESTRELDRRLLELNERVRFGFDRVSLAVTWLGTSTRQGASAKEGDPCTTCCVVCAGEEHCACRVITPCGGCCCPDVCSCIATAAPLRHPVDAAALSGAGCAAPVKRR
jgi:hypothetical protein